jgi:hypothetical protein
MNRALDEPEGTKRAETVVADMGYFKLDELSQLQDLEFETIVKDPLGNRRLDKLTESGRAALDTAHAAVASEGGKALLKRRGDYQTCENQPPHQGPSHCLHRSEPIRSQC